MALRSRSGAESSYAPTADLSPKTKRYLPKKAWENMSEGEGKPRRKARGLAKGQAARLEYRRGEGGAQGAPVEGRARPRLRRHERRGGVAKEVLTPRIRQYRARAAYPFRSPAHAPTRAPTPPPRSCTGGSLTVGVQALRQLFAFLPAASRFAVVGHHLSLPLARLSSFTSNVHLGGYDPPDFSPRSLECPS